MKIRAPIGFVVIATALITLVLWHGRKKPAEIPTAISPVNVVSPTVAVANAPVQSNALAVTQAVSSVPTSTPSVKSKEQQMREQLANFNDVDIEFYGRLEDQFGAVVDNAKIKFEVPFNNGHTVGVNRGTTTADGNGYFTISGYRGKSLSIIPLKDGYVLASLNGGGIYSYLWPESQRVHPDRNNPTVIKMWKLQGTEPLVSISKEYKLSFTNAPIYFDLVAGKTVPSGGDIKIKINRPVGEVSEHNPQKWSINFEVLDGGFIVTSSKESAITFAAPKDDYLPKGIFENNNGTDGLDENFFVESRHGQVFSKVYLSIGINNQPDGLIYITVRGVANTNSSRNWEATIPQ